MRYWKIAFVCFMLLLLDVCLREFYYGTQGPDVKFQLDSNHFLMGWPGFIVQYEPDGSSDTVMLKDANSQEFCPSAISKYAVTDKYIIAKAKEGWLAINRESLQACGCYKTIDELENKIGKKFGVLNMVEEFSRSNVYVPRKTWIALIIISLVFVGIIVGVILLPIRKKKIDS